MGSKGINNKSFTLWEELELRVSTDSGKVAIYKKTYNDKRQGRTPLPIEDRSYFVHIPVPNTKGGIRKSLLTKDRTTAITKVNEMVVNVMVDLRSGNSIIPVPVEDVVEKFLKHKKSRTRGRWESKRDRGKKSITSERYTLIEGKLRNYLIGFLGKKTDVRTIPFKRWSKWEEWRIENNVRKEMGKPKSVTIQNEMGLIRECWKWGMVEGYIPTSLKLPFHDEDLISDDKVSRDTWNANEWRSFSRRLRDWLKETESNPDENYVWDAYVSYQMVFFISNCGMRTGEVVKVKRKDIEFVQLNDEYKNLICLVQVHPSTKTGEREVNAMGGKFARRVFEKSPHRKKNDFLFCHLDGSEFTTKQFRTWFYRMTKFTDENNRWGKTFQPYGLRHYYATTRLQNGTSQYALCKNMGVTEPYLRKHYSKYLTKLATKELMKFSKDIGLGGDIITDGKDFLIDEI